jgi:hypothetical protein
VPGVAPTSPLFLYDKPDGQFPVASRYRYSRKLSDENEKIADLLIGLCFLYLRREARNGNPNAYHELEAVQLPRVMSPTWP